jgi:hypothetical protein
VEESGLNLILAAGVFHVAQRQNQLTIVMKMTGHYYQLGISRAIDQAIRIVYTLRPVTR